MKFYDRVKEQQVLGEVLQQSYVVPIDLNHRAECFVSTDYRKIGFWILGDLEDV